MSGKSTVTIGWVPKGIVSPPALKTSYEIWEGDLPTSIKVVRPPNKTTYAPGEKIDMTGAHIFAYDDNNNIVCRVPLNEITLEPAVAPGASS